jgi:hypothetical protein
MHQLPRKRNNTMFALHTLPVQMQRLLMVGTFIRTWETGPVEPLLSRSRHQFIGHRVALVQFRQGGEFLAV